ncbi:hypothetical protein JTE90_016826 [Oedothorax gibbosus]|uniref:MD-2-related lipid-recognition domain-containing protein n=1 Tax=Oedothorax gibbosus TaxID=931172 RepID=A0AAV6VXJ2_9ARAC|nr:hypothetical protein JTE90_016826 [Oedothorax gibbosus]
MALFYLPFLLFSVSQFDGSYAGATFADCGDANKRLTISTGTVKPDPIQYPGNISASVDLIVLKDLPADNFEMKLDLTKLQPRKMTVPCLQDIGSCTYDVCSIINNHKESFCPAFPDPTKCGCPMKAATYSLKNVGVAIPNFGEIFVNILKGGYEGKITFHDKSSGTEIGCVAITFEIVPAS